MLEKLKQIENLVFVGGFAMTKLGIKESYSDIDIVVIILMMKYTSFK